MNAAGSSDPERLRLEQIKPEALKAGQRAAIECDVAWLTAHRDRFVAVTCPACGKGNGDRLYIKNALTQVRCPHCGTQYASPRPDAALLREFYARSENYAYWAKYIFPASAEARRVKIFQPRAEQAAALGKRLNRNGLAVEIGTGCGLFCEELKRFGQFESILGIEPTPDLAANCRARGVEIIEASYELAKLPGPADLIAAFEVIEHLADPAGFLVWVREALAPGGVLLLTCPNIRGFDTISLGAESDAIDHEHINLFTPDSLAMLASRTGLTEVEVTTPGKLDAEIVARAYRNGRVDESRLGAFLNAIMREEDQDMLADLQELIRRHGWSSNMMLTALKKSLS